MTKTLRILVPLASLLALAGCAKLTHQPVAEFADSPGGIPYYEGAHYLLVHTDGKGSVVSKLMFLPDLNRKRVARPKQIFARLDTTLKFSNGVLTKSRAEGDTTAVPKAVIEAIGRVAPALASLANRVEGDGGKDGHTLPPPHLYRVTWDAGKLRLVGGPGTETIGVTLVPGAEKTK